MCCSSSDDTRAREAGRGAADKTWEGNDSGYCTLPRSDDWTPDFRSEPQKSRWDVGKEPRGEHWGTQTSSLGL